jgi:hypothetical protein
MALEIHPGLIRCLNATPAANTSDWRGVASAQQTQKALRQRSSWDGTLVVDLTRVLAWHGLSYGSGLHGSYAGHSRRRLDFDHPHSAYPNGLISVKTMTTRVGHCVSAVHCVTCLDIGK